MNKDRYYQLIDKERNIYELAELYPQNRKDVSEYLDILQDPISQTTLAIDNDTLIGDQKYNIEDNVANFTSNDTNSEEWKKLNSQFFKLSQISFCIYPSELSSY